MRNNTETFTIRTYMWPHKERRWDGPTAQEVRAARRKEHQEQLQKLAKRNR